MKFYPNNNKYYNFPTFDFIHKSKLPKSFFNFTILISIKQFNIKFNKNHNNKFLPFETMLDSGSACNFISNKIVEQFNINKINLPKPITLEGITGSAIIDKFVELEFQFQLKINNKLYFNTFKEKFLIINNIPTDFIIGNIFIRKYQLNFDYKKLLQT